MTIKHAKDLADARTALEHETRRFNRLVAEAKTQLRELRDGMHEANKLIESPAKLAKVRDKAWHFANHATAIYQAQLTVEHCREQVERVERWIREEEALEAEKEATR